jgi:hypothetical protein
MKCSIYNFKWTWHNLNGRLCTKEIIWTYARWTGNGTVTKQKLIVTCISIAWHRVGKHTSAKHTRSIGHPLRGNGPVNMHSWQQKTVFSIGFEKDCAGKGQQHVQKTETSSRERGRPTKTRPSLSNSNKYLVMSPDTKTYWLTDRQSQCDFDFETGRSTEQQWSELGRVLEPKATEKKWHERNQTVTRRLHMRFEVTMRCDKPVARIRLVKTENPSACVTVNCEVCGNSDSAVLPIVQSCVNKVQKIQSSNPEPVLILTPTCDIIIILTGTG